jgi:hypothetical protein
VSGPRKTSRPTKKPLVSGRVTAINGRPIRGKVTVSRLQLSHRSEIRRRFPFAPTEFKAKPGLGGRRHRLRRAKAVRP